MITVEDGTISISDLLDEMTRLRTEVATQGQRIFADFEKHIQRENYRDSALNLAHYLALRHHNLRDLQFKLMQIGFASLGSIEANVLGTLTATERILKSLHHGTPLELVPAESYFAGMRRLHQEADEVLGPRPESRSARIMVTLHTQAATDKDFVLDLIDRGMNCARINCAHDNARVWQAMIDNVRQAAASRGQPCQIYMDLAGPKIRTKAVGFDRTHLFYPGDTLLLTREEPTATNRYPYQVNCLVPEVLDQVAVNQTVWFDDGKIGTRITEIIPEGLVLKIEKTSPEGTRMRIRKGINFPDTKLQIDPLTQKDRKDLDFIAQHADMVGYSFVQTGDDIALLQAELEKRLQTPEDMQRIAIIAKIETRRAVASLPDLIIRGAGQQPFGVMVARGDLAVEIGFERLAEIQEEILWVCEAARVPVIWATQVLESVTKRGVTSRAEITDAASGIKAECVMLNKGKYVGQAVSMLHDVLSRMTGHQYKQFIVLRDLKSWERYVRD